VSVGSSLVVGIIGIVLDQRKRLAIVVTLAGVLVFTVPYWLMLLLRLQASIRGY